MKIRRYYDNRKQYDRQWFPEHKDIDSYLVAMRQLGYSDDQAMDIDNAEYEIILNHEEQASWFFDCLDRVYRNPGWYLDNLEKVGTFDVDIKQIFPKPVPGPGLLHKEPGINGKRGRKYKLL